MNDINQKINAGEMITISNLLPERKEEDVIDEIFKGLKADQKYISSKYFYDREGSKLFEEITKLEEYYLTRSEISILNRIAPKIADELRNYNIIELGNGDCSKISILFDSIPVSKRKLVKYFPVDVSASAIRESANKLTGLFPEIKIHGIIADFISQFIIIPEASGRLVCFFGSTIGNLNIEESSEFLRNISLNMKHGDQLLLGLDMVKPKDIIEKAYNDNKQVTAAFNKNILNVVNGIVKTDFDLNKFDHLAFFNEEKSRIEMHLKAKEYQIISSPMFKEKIQINKGETIHTENSCKYTLSQITALGTSSELTLKNIFTDENKWFSLVEFVK